MARTAPALDCIVWSADFDMATPDAALAQVTDLLTTTQCLLRHPQPSRLWVVTCGAQSVDGVLATDPARAAVGGSLWGMGRTIAREEPRLRTMLIDLDPEVGLTSQAEVLAQELTVQTRDPEVAWRHGTRFSAQVVPQPLLPGRDLVRLELGTYGSLESLRYVPLTPRQPGPGEVTVQVHAAGLNLRDLLNSLGMLQDYYATVLGIRRSVDVGLGLECVGTVTAVGPGVSHLAIGDRVMGMAVREGAFASMVTLPVATLTHVPAALRDAEAATIPLAYLTAWYALVERAKLQPGERVLIHAAAGGVGQAAVQIARLLGAEVVATASPGKWALLQEQGVGLVANSRTLDFVAEVQAHTEGRGVDIVLNSLTGAFIPASLEVLGQGGRFVEIGKVGIWSREEVAAQRPDVAYHPFDLGEDLATDATLGPRLWAALGAELAAGRLRPLPHTVYPAQDVVRALRTMQQARHVGKLVLTFPSHGRGTLDPAASYLVTGGLGALGLEVAQQLVADGARHLLLVSRRGPATAAQQQVLASLAEAGATLQVVRADIADATAVQNLLTQAAALGPLRGIVHAAGVLDDGLLTSLNASRLATVMGPKAAGVWHLHQQTQGMALDFFVAFSSMASLIGNPGQANYAAANGFLDGLMQQRHAASTGGPGPRWAWPRGCGRRWSSRGGR